MTAARFTLTAGEIEQLEDASRSLPPYPNDFYELFCKRDSPYYGGHRVGWDETEGKSAATRQGNSDA